MAIEIRAEAPADRTRIFEIVSAAFGRTAEADLVDALRESAHPQLSLVAVSNREIAGHVFLSPVSLDSAPSLGAAALGPISVAPAHQGRGVGASLVRAGLRESAVHGWRAVFLVGDPRYYARFGFEPAGPRGFVYGVPLFEPAFQFVELAAGALAGCGGTVRFHPAFAEAEGG